MVFKELGASIFAVNDLLNNQANFRANNAEGIQLLANSVSGLTANQQALLLSSKNLSAETVRQILETNELTEAEINHAMAIAGLTTTTKNLSYQKLQDILISQTGNAEKAKEIATILGVEAAEESEIITLKGLSYAQLEAKLTQAGLNQEQIKSIAIQLGYTTGIAKATTATTIFGQTLKGLLFSLKSAGLAIKTFALSHPIISGIAIAITAAATAWGVYKHSQKELREAEEAANEREKERTESLKQEIEDIDSIIKEYKELGNKTELTADEKDRLISLQKKLNQSYDTESAGIDLVNGKYDEQIQKLKNLNAEKQESLRRSVKAQRQSAYAAYNQNATNNIITKSIGKAIKSEFEDEGEDFYSRLTKAIFEKNINGVSSDVNGNIAVSGELNSEEKVKALNEIQDALDRVTTTADKKTLSFKLLNDRVAELIKNYDEEVDNYNSLLQEEVGLLVESFSYNGTNIDNITQETGIAWRDALKDTFAKDDPQLRLAINDYYDDYILPTFQNNNDELAEKVSFNWSEFYDEQGLEDVEKKLKTLKTAYKSLEENGTLGNDEKSDLLKDYPELLDVIDDPNKLKVALQSSANDAISAAQLVLSNLYLAAKAGSLEESNLKEALEVLEGMADVSSKVTDQYAEQKEILKKQLYETKQLINKAKEKKEAEQENLETFKKQKEALEKILDNYETAVSVVTNYIDEQIDSLEEQKDAVQETYDKQIQALEDEADERERINDLREKELELEKAKNTQVRVYDKERGGFTIQQNQEAIKQAQKEYDNAVKDSRIAELEKERDEALAPFDSQISELEAYKKSWEDAVKAYQKTQDEMTAAAVFGSDWRNMVIEKDTGAIGAFVQNYGNTAYQLHSIIEPQIEQTEKNIDVIEKEIDSYEDLQNKQKSYLDFFKTYSKDFAIAVGEQKDALVNFANAIKNNATASELFRLYDTVMSKFSSDYIPEFANGGVSTSTGLAMLHGTKQKSEVTFNAEDARKLYEAIHGSSSIQLGNQLAKNLISSALQATRDSASVVNNNQPTKIENTWVINEPKFSSSEDYRVFANHMDRYVREANMNRLVGKR